MPPASGESKPQWARRMHPAEASEHHPRRGRRGTRKPSPRGPGSPSTVRSPPNRLHSLLYHESPRVPQNGEKVHRRPAMAPFQAVAAGLTRGSTPRCGSARAGFVGLGHASIATRGPGTRPTAWPAGVGRGSGGPVAELADAADLKSAFPPEVRVRVPPGPCAVGGRTTRCLDGAAPPG